MNELKLFTHRAPGDRVRVDWATGRNMGGAFLVTMPAMEDVAIAAELAVARLLLEDRNVCGHGKTGAGLVITFSFGAVRKLVRESSAKAHLAPYALFLRTRFIGCDCRIDAVPRGDFAHPDTPVEDLVVAGAVPEFIRLGEHGDVAVTAHAVEKFQERFCPNPKKVWARLQRCAADAKPSERRRRNAAEDAKHRQKAEYASARYPGGEPILFVIGDARPLAGRMILTVLNAPA